MFFNLQKTRVFQTMGQKGPMFRNIDEAISSATELEFIYLFWNNRVYDIQGYDTGLRPKDLL